MNQVKTEGYAVLGQHESSILGLGFQGTTALAGKRLTAATTADPTLAARGIKTPEYKPERRVAQTRETLESSSMMPSGREGGKQYDLAEHNAQARQAFDTSATAAASLGREGGTAMPFSPGGGAPSARRDDRGPMRSDDRNLIRSGGSERSKSKRVEEEIGVGLVLLSASMDGSVRAWETLGKSEKYCMRHPAAEEVTTMLVLPGGSILVTGETQSVAALGTSGTARTRSLHACRTWQRRDRRTMPR